MGSSDAMAFSFAVAAVAAGILVTAYLFVSSRQRGDDTAPMPPDVADPQHLDIPHHLDIRLIVASPGTACWRLESRLDDRMIVVDAFTHRVASDVAELGWRHELMAAPLMLPPRHKADIAIGASGKQFEAAIAWFVGDSPDHERTSQFIRDRLPG